MKGTATVQPMSPSEREAQMSAADRKTRHAIMRKLERADWALKEEDADDAVKAISAASRLVLKLHEPAEELPRVVGRALVVALEEADYGANEPMGVVINAAVPLLVLEGENFRGCDYGM